MKMEKWQLDALNFEVKAIETFLGYKFEGKTIEDKQVFVTKHKDKRVDVTIKMLKQTYEDHVKTPAQSMKVYAINDFNHVLHYSWEEALNYYTELVGQDTFDKQKDECTGDEFEPSEFFVVITKEESVLRGTVKELIEKGVITGVEHFASALLKQYSQNRKI